MGKKKKKSWVQGKLLCLSQFALLSNRNASIIFDLSLNQLICVLVLILMRKT